MMSSALPLCKGFLCFFQLYMDGLQSIQFLGGQSTNYIYSPTVVAGVYAIADHQKHGTAQERDRGKGQDLHVPVHRMRGIVEFQQGHHSDRVYEVTQKDEPDHGRGCDGPGPNQLPYEGRRLLGACPGLQHQDDPFAPTLASLNILLHEHPQHRHSCYQDSFVMQRSSNHHYL